MSSNWIGKAERLALYTRDEFVCQYCGNPVVAGEQLPPADGVGPVPREASLDHVVPRSCGGSHDPSNLVTCCGQCNSSKCDALGLAATMWLGQRAKAMGLKRTELERRIRRQTRRPVARLVALAKKQLALSL